MTVMRSRSSRSAQVLIRRHIRLGNIVIPKSVIPKRIASDFDVFDRELSADQMAWISSLQDGTQLGPDPRTVNFTDIHRYSQVGEQRDS